MANSTILVAMDHLKPLLSQRLGQDPLPVVHRPLMVYAGTSLFCPMVSYKAGRNDV